MKIREKRKIEQNLIVVVYSDKILKLFLKTWAKNRIKPSNTDSYENLDQLLIKK